ncbi:MAG: response regulator [Deltaproteobacteria bacterium]|nr:response regulator [Deltaproteobacteria bacterium]
MNNGDAAKLGKLNLKKLVVHADNLNSTEQDVSDITKQLEDLSENFGVPAVNLDDVQIQLEVLNIVPFEIAQQHGILPFAVSGENLKLAMKVPDDKKIIDEIEFVSGKKIFPHIALPIQLDTLIEKCYSSLDSGEKVYTGPGYEDALSRSKQKAQVAKVQEPSASQAATVLGKSASDLPSVDELSLDIEIDVPLNQQISSMYPAISAPEPQLEVQKKVLVVDDEDDIRLLISRVLTEKGYDVVTASRGLEAVSMVQTEEPDIIILDAMLPEVHGFDICKKIKGSKKYGHIPVIMISAIYRGWRYAQDLKDSYGVDDFIEKPFKLAEFLEKVEKHINVSKSSVDEEAQEDLTRKIEGILVESINSYKAGHIDKAIELLKKGLQIDPLAYKLHYNLALLLGKKSLTYQAIRELESTLELEPDYFPAMKNLALLYQKAGFKFKAIETWERSLHYCSDEETRNSIKQHLMDII